jgi:TnpA family transposase
VATVLTDPKQTLLRLIATIKLKETTASDIFRRLNSCSRQHSLYHTSGDLEALSMAGAGESAAQSA